MAFEVFLSYRNGPEEQLVVWRLQTLAASYGINVLVPPRNGSQGGPSRGKQLSQDVRRKIDEADCVLAILNGIPGAAVQAELMYALTRHKTVIPILRAGLDQSGFLSRLPRVFRFSPQDPGNVEAEVIEFLKQQEFKKESRQAVGALVMVGLGLFLMSALSEK